MFFWNERPRWPPSPTVEDEIESLSRELHGLAKIGDKPGIEGVCARGSIDQYPLIIEAFSLTTIVQSDILGGYGHESSSSVDSSGPPTPPLDSKQPILFDTGNAKQQGSQLKPVSLATPPTSRDTSPLGQPRAPASQPVRNSRPTASQQRPLDSSAQSSKAQKDSASALHKAASNLSPLKFTKPAPPMRMSSLPSKPTSSIPKRPETVNSSRSAGSSTTKVHQPTPLNPGLTNNSNPSTPKSTSSLASKPPASSVPKPVGVKPGRPTVHPTAKVQQPLPANPGPLKATSPSLTARASSLASKPPASVLKQPGGVKPDQPAGQSTARQAANVKQPLLVSPSLQKVAKSSTQVLSPPLPSKSVSAVPERSESAKSDSPSPTRLPAANAQQPSTAPGYQSNSATVKTKGRGDGSNRSPGPQGSEKPSVGPSSTLSLAERLEEKMRRRHEQRDHGSSSEDAQKKSGPPTPVSVVKPASPIVAKSGPPATSLESAGQASRPQPAPRTVTINPPSINKGSRPTSLVETPVPKLVPSEPSAPILPKRTVSFQTGALKPTSWRNPEDTLEHLQSLQISLPQPVRPPSPSRSGQSLLPCPRPVPVAGYQDWYTIKGMSHLDICPSCLKQMRKSKFRDVFILGTPRPRLEKIRCAMSEPWVRLAWMQTINKQLDHLHLLCQIAQPPPGTKPCTGRIVSEQYWYRVVDPDTEAFLPKFNICSACVRNLRILMPPHQDTFKLCTTLQERVCDFVTDSPRFVRYIDLLDIAANRAEQEHSPQPKLSEFMAYARRKVVLRDCRRSRLALNTWHYIPQLPELTVCEDCYDDVVWPMVKANYPIARKFSAMMRLPPGDGLARSREASCQLYSPRMRLKFREAVEENDLAYLNMITLKRYEAEQHYRKQRNQLLEDEERGYDCEAELRRNLEEWKRWE